MKTQSVDTSPEAERVLIGMLRKASFIRRFHLTQSWSSSIIEAARINVQQLFPSATEQEVMFLAAERQHGKTVVDQLRTIFQVQQRYPSAVLDFLAALKPVMEALTHLSVPFALAGSLACSLYGMQRATTMLEVFAPLSSEQRKMLITSLSSDYFFLEAEKHQDSQKYSSYTFIHMDSLLSITLIDAQVQEDVEDIMSRVRPLVIMEGFPALPVLAPEDVAIQLLEKVQQSGKQMDDLWYDLLGLLKVQGPTLDFQLLARQAAQRNLTLLLQEALDDAGLEENPSQASISYPQ